MNPPSRYANWPYAGAAPVQSAPLAPPPEPPVQSGASASDRAAPALQASERSQVMKETAPMLEPEPAAAPAKRASKPAKPAAKPAAKAPPEAPTPAAVLKAGSEVKLPSVNKRATQAAMQAQMSQAVEPSHDPAAAKATFSPSPERVLVPVTPVIAKKDPALANHWKTRTLEQLCEADVLSMPDAEYMNEVQLAYFRRKLQQLKHDILVNEIGRAHV